MSGTTLAARAKQALTNHDEKPRARTELVRVYKAFRKLEEARLKMRHRAGDDGQEVCRTRSDMMDILLKHLWREALPICEVPNADKFPISVVAVGGYARQCMNPYSDLDVTFLLPGAGLHPSREEAKVISFFINLMWEVKIHLGDHSTRSVGETFRGANGNYEIKTSLIDARLIAGHEKAFMDFQKGFDKHCFNKQEAAFLRDRQSDIAARHAKYENTPYRQEPNVKSGPGGLREYHNLQWITYAKFRTTDLRELVKRELIAPNALREIEAAYGFILRVRSELHTLERRESDVLTLKLQGQAVSRLGYSQRGILRRIEALMRDYYGHSVNMLHRTSEVLDRLHLLTLEEESRGVKGFLARRRARVEKFDGFIAKLEREEKDARIYAEDASIFKDDPPRLMRLFVQTQQRHLRLSPDLFQLVQKSLKLVNTNFRQNQAVRESFEAILSRKGDVGRALRQMHRTGFLGRYMPEFGALTNLVQHEFFHQYTADEHTLRCVERLDELAGTPKPGNEFFAKLFRELQEPVILYLALILHDAGRAANSASHSTDSADMAMNVSKRMGISGERRRLLLFLVDSHLELYRTATKLNIDDATVIADFARVVRNQGYLDALLVFTVVDSKGTSAGGWTSWKESMILQLYRNTSEYLNDPTDFLSRATAPLDELKQEVLKHSKASHAQEIETHFASMPRSYFNFRAADNIAFHMRAIRWHEERVEANPDVASLPTLTWVNHPEQGCSELIVVCRDRPLLLARVSGALSANNINILSADLYQRSDGIVLDIFRVCTTNFEPVTSDRSRTRVRASADAAFQSEDFDFSHEINAHRRPLRGLQEFAEIPQRVYINNDRSANQTLIDLQAIDRIGLLYDIFSTIGNLGLNITHARINTEKGAALDAIYVQDKDGHKVTDKHILAKLKEGLNKAVFT
jgi:[protein-PII] uridylyltransferase